MLIYLVFFNILLWLGCFPVFFLLFAHFTLHCTTSHCTVLRHSLHAVTTPPAPLYTLSTVNTLYLTLLSLFIFYFLLLTCSHLFTLWVFSFVYTLSYFCFNSSPGTIAHTCVFRNFFHLLSAFTLCQHFICTSHDTSEDFSIHLKTFSYIWRLLHILPNTFDKCLHTSLSLCILSRRQTSSAFI